MLLSSLALQSSLLLLLLPLTSLQAARNTQKCLLKAHFSPSHLTMFLLPCINFTTAKTHGHEPLQ
jgi:hypothetical protein